jgi:hypothetical protein
VPLSAVRLGDLEWELGRECLGARTRATFEKTSFKSSRFVTVCDSVAYLRLELGDENGNLYLVFGRFPAELGPETRSNGSGSKNGAERTHAKRPGLSQNGYGHTAQWQH